MSSKKHVIILKGKLNRGIFALTQVKQSLNPDQIKSVYHAHFGSHISFGTVLWADERRNKGLCTSIFRLQKKALRILEYGTVERKSCRVIFRKHALLTLTSIFILQAVTIAFKYRKKLTNAKVHDHNTRYKNQLHMNKGEYKSPIYASEPLNNCLPNRFKIIAGIDEFKREVKVWLKEKEYYCLEEFAPQLC